MKNRALAFIALGLMFSILLSRRAAAAGMVPTPAPAPSPTPGVEELLKRLDSEDEKERTEAKIALVKIGPSISPRLLQELPSAPPPKAYDLILILDYFRAASAAPVYKKLWEGTEDMKIKLVAAMALCRLDQDYSIYQDFIVAQTKGGSDSNRLQAMQMLGYLRDARAVPVLKAIFYDAAQSDNMRQAAIWDLSHTPVSESAQVLVDISQDPEIDWFYKEIVFAALKRLAGEKDMAPVVNRLLEKAQRLPVTSAPSPVPAPKSSPR
jgi:HEAT repeat protein